jgi:hypothetical protein
MIMRKNTLFEQVVKKGIEMSKKNHTRSAGQMMSKAGIPYIVIDRVLYEQHKI